MSSDLRRRILDYVAAHHDDMLAIARAYASTQKYVVIPIMIDGVLDSVRYNSAEDRLDQITIVWAKGDVTPLVYGAAYCSDFQIEVINL